MGTLVECRWEGGRDRGFSLVNRGQERVGFSSNDPRGDTGVSVSKSFMKGSKTTAGP